MKRIFYIIPALGLAFGGALCLTAQSDTMPVTATGTEQVSETDSVAPSPGEILASELAEAYKALKFMEYEGEQEEVLYRTGYDVNDLAVRSLLASENDDQANRARTVIADVHPLLLQGAFYHSGKGNSSETTRFARAFVDVEQMPEMSAIAFKTDPKVMSQLAYSAAYGAVNSGDNEKAKQYFEAYLNTGETAQRENVVVFYGQCCVQTQDWGRGIDVLEEAVSQYPLNPRIINLAMQCAIDGGYPDRLQNLLDRALALNPDDQNLLDLQAKLYSTNRDFRKALDIYLKIAEVRPQSLENTRRIATCYYNLGATYYNQSIMEEDEKVSKRAHRQSQAYFNSAAESLEQLLGTTPSDIKYLRALAQTYAALGEKERFESVNSRLIGFGEKGVAFNAMPVMIEGDSFAGASGKTAVTVPTFAEFARPFIEERLGTWAQRGEFEKLEDYKKRVASGGGVDEYRAINKAAEKEYLDRYARQLVLDDLKRSDYDVDNETYNISTPYGDAVLKVPYKNREAELFKSGWESAQIRKPRFIIRDDRVALAEVTFVVNGKKYTYNSADAAEYRTPEVYVDINSILAAASTGDQKGSPSAAGRNATMVFADSDVDVNIPLTTRKSDNLYAVIIANEHYDNADEVFGALHDGYSFHQYCTRTLGVPDHQAFLLNNATGNQIRDIMEQLSRKVKGTGPEAEVIFYYAGHGLPDDATKEAYLLPSDGNPRTTSTLVPMKELYHALGRMDAKAVSVFVDACFSGSSRNQTGVKKGERAVVMKPRDAEPEGNMFILTAANGQQTALPYTEKQHGLFTYYLLKKLQESKGNATLKQISDYVKKEVEQTSNRVNGKEQTPTVSVSGSLAASWDSKKLKP